MESGTFVGRVGGLAVALGIGAAMAAGNGVAWAGPTGSEGDTSQGGASAAGGEPDSAGQQQGGAESGSTGLTGPLSRIGERVRKTLEDSANSLIKRANRASDGAFDNRSGADTAMDEGERTIQIRIRRTPPSTDTPVAEVPASDTQAGLLGAVRSSIATAPDAKPARGNDTNVDLNKGRSEPVSTLRGWTSTKRADTLGANVEDAAMTAVTRGVDSLPSVVGARLTTVTESAVNVVPARRCSRRPHRRPSCGNPPLPMRCRGYWPRSGSCHWRAPARQTRANRQRCGRCWHSLAVRSAPALLRNSPRCL